MEQPPSSETPADATPDAEPEIQPGPPPSGRGLRWLWPVVCCLQLGLQIGGYLVYQKNLADHPSPPPEASRPPEARKTRAPDLSVPPATSHGTDDLERGDRLFQAGRYDLALPVFRAFAPNAAAPLRDQVQYRVALCLEGLGRWEEAGTAYRALLDQNPNPRAVAAGEVGLARVWLRSNRPEEVRNLLCQFLLRSARSADLIPAALAEAQFVLALAFIREFENSEKAGKALDQIADLLTINWALDRALTWANPPGEAERKEPEPIPDGLVVLPNTAAPEESLVRASVAEMPVVQLLDGLAPNCGLKAQWSAKALRQVEGRPVTVQVDQISFLDLARDLVCPLRLLWKIEDGVVYWSSADEVTPAELGAWRAALARRTLREAVLAHPKHELAPVAYVSLGNLEARAGHFPAAVAWYEQLIRDEARSPLLVEANYNLGLVQHRLGQDDSARKAFYRVVDQAPGNALAPLAYLALGRTWLEGGQPERAISPLRRGLAVGVGSPARPVLVLTLAAAHLWAGNPRAANAVLLAHRPQVNQPPYRQTAAFLDAFSRFQAAGDRRQTRHAGDLLAALLTVGDAAELGPLGVLLIGRAYQQLGMIDQMTAVYEKALKEVRGPVAEEMSYTLATALGTVGKLDQAKNLFLSLTVQGDSRWVRAAKFRLAELALEENRPQEVLLWGRQLLPVYPPEQLPALLELLGRAFEQTGNYEQAARCFRGEKPL